MVKINGVPEATEYEKIGGVGVLRYERLNKIPWLLHAFSTREGGVSQGQYATMNLSFTVGDDPICVEENFRRFGAAIGVPVESMVYAHQTHTDHVLVVDETKKGMGVIRERDYRDIDGLVTNRPGVCLVTSYADCVPLYIVDPVKKAIGLTHSGWRGTVAKIGAKTIARMEKMYQSDPKDLLCVIGPCIGKSCYEVSEEVADAFGKAYTREQYARICVPEEGKAGKYLLDLSAANYEQFVECGVLPDNVVLPDLCTACNGAVLHSHRASGGKRGGMCAFLMIQE